MERRIPRRLAHEPKALREARRRAGKSQAWLAEHLGCSRSLVVEMEAGTRSDRRSTRLRRRGHRGGTGRRPGDAGISAAPLVTRADAIRNATRIRARRAQAAGMANLAEPARKTA
jgi:DNA-binding XRE family transcriptional regulator